MRKEKSVLVYWFDKIMTKKWLGGREGVFWLTLLHYSPSQRESVSEIQEGAGGRNLNRNQREMLLPDFLFLAQNALLYNLGPTATD